MENNINEIEKKLQAFFEDQLQRLSGADPIKYATQEVLAAQINQIIEKNQKSYSPNIFRITFKRKKYIDPKDLEFWETFISDMIKDTARESNLLFSGPVHVQHFFDSSIQKEVSVEVAFSSISTRKTTNLMIGSEKNEPSGNVLKGYLITHQETIFPLKKKVTNIGRDEENDLVIDNLRVSRVHAQIREINGSHVLFDLDSTVGTRVNKRRLNQHTLATGDVIEIADVALIYGADSEHDGLIQNHFHTKAFPQQERNK
jgi:hypothetical protein